MVWKINIDSPSLGRADPIERILASWYLLLDLIMLNCANLYSIMWTKMGRLWMLSLFLLLFWRLERFTFLMRCEVLTLFHPKMIYLFVWFLCFWLLFGSRRLASSIQLWWWLRRELFVLPWFRFWFERIRIWWSHFHFKHFQNWQFEVDNHQLLTFSYWLLHTQFSLKLALISLFCQENRAKSCCTYWLVLHHILEESFFRSAGRMSGKLLNLLST